MRPKSSTVAYLFWLLLGCHYLYLRKPFIQLLYWVTWGGFFVRMFVDLFRIPGMVDEWNQRTFEPEMFPPRPILRSPQTFSGIDTPDARLVRAGARALRGLWWLALTLLALAIGISLASLNHSPR